MPEDTLEQVRLLSNLESNRHKLLQIVLFGQPELDADAGQAELRQLRDRITHSLPHAAAHAAGGGEVPVVPHARRRLPRPRGVHAARRAALIARASDGLTRRINILADKALLAAFTENTHAITDRHVRAAVADSEFAGAAPVLARRCALPGRRRRRRRRRGRRPASGCARRRRCEPPARAPAPPAPAAPRRRRRSRRTRAGTRQEDPPSRARAAAERRAGAPPGRATRPRGQRAARRAARRQPRAARAAPTTSAMRSSSTSPTTAIRRAWSASCSAPASWCRWRN